MLIGGIESTNNEKKSLAEEFPLILVLELNSLSASEIIVENIMLNSVGASTLIVGYWKGIGRFTVVDDNRGTVKVFSLSFKCLLLVCKQCCSVNAK